MKEKERAVVPSSSPSLTSTAEAPPATDGEVVMVEEVVTVAEENRDRLLLGPPASSRTQPQGNSTLARMKNVKGQETQVFSSSHVDDLVDKKDWDSLEAYLISFIPTSHPLESHPMLFLRIRISHAIDLINQKCFSAAHQYFEEHIRSPFQKVIEEGGTGHKNASIADLTDGLAHIADCLTEKSTPRLYTGSLTKLMVNDYMRLYLPENIGYKVHGKKDVFWAFAFPLDYGLTRPSYRCLACSQKVFHSASIRDLPPHLEVCPKMNTPYVEDLFVHCKILKEESTAAQSDQKPAGVEKAARKRGRTDLTTQAGTSTVADEKGILAEIAREIESADDLHRKMGGEVHKVINMHKRMGEVVENIVGMHTGIGHIVNKVKCLACPGPCPVAPVADPAGRDLGATDTTIISAGTDLAATDPAGNKAEVEEGELHWDGLMMVDHTSNPTDGLMSYEEIIEFFETE